MNKDQHPIHVIGTDAGGLETLDASLMKLVLQAKSIAAPQRILNILPEWWLKRTGNAPPAELLATNKPQELINWLEKQQQITTVLASGDPLWFGIGRFLANSSIAHRISFHPSPTSLQLAFARIGIPWHEAQWISLHGRDSYPLGILLKQKPKQLVILTDPNKGGVEEVREYLRTFEVEDSYDLWLFERLGHSQEKVQQVRPSDKTAKKIDPLSLVILLLKESQGSITENLTLFGIPDGKYFHHEDRPGLMTKREVRVQLLADLDLPEEGVLWDIGAGVGSIGLEALRLRPKLKLLAVEKRVGGKELIKANANLLSVKPKLILEGEFLNLLEAKNISEELLTPNRVILGGGGSMRKEMAQAILKRMHRSGKIIIPIVTIEALNELKIVLNSFNLRTTVSEHQSWRGINLSLGTRLSPMNPVFILKGEMQ